MDWRWKPMEPMAPRIGLKGFRGRVAVAENRAISKFVKSVSCVSLIIKIWVPHRRSERWWDTNREILLEVLLVSFSGSVNILLGWWEKLTYFLKISPPNLGEKGFPIWRAYFSLVGWFNHQLELIHCTPDHWLRFPNRSKRWWCCTTTARRGHVAYVRIDTLLKNDLTLNMYNMSSKGEGTLSKSLGFHICVVVDCWGTDRLPAPKVNQHLTEVRTCLWSFGAFFASPESWEPKFWRNFCTAGTPVDYSNYIPPKLTGNARENKSNQGNRLLKHHFSGGFYGG